MKFSFCSDFIQQMIGFMHNLVNHTYINQSFDEQKLLEKRELNLI